MSALDKAVALLGKPYRYEVMRGVTTGFDMHPLSDADLFYALLLELGRRECWPSVRSVTDDEGVVEWEAEAQDHGITVYDESPIAAILELVAAMDLPDSAWKSPDADGEKQA